ncbi:MAG: carbohydrate kinase [Rothia sp. (in: high G+C Gram-positive bacteria)]|uniref:carbohydrate kinase family protein n=1 Tax=Rothia sp. (in: high G+C Gram-positive bacteria) TaxID=1885016 RepID=UPI0026DBBF00|nr:carbohydrate kinase [Rothia sp. (in: high G+C Gram-positive bacteria)]MDO4883387.1 carbohydrate kinase [Rothia sp. (in: high G+C Gram-positive bacteria)]
MLTVIGEALVDVVHKRGEQTRAYPGGSPMNVAVGVSRLGHTTQFVGHYGTDDYGRAISEHLSASGVTVPFAPAAARTSTAQAHIGQGGTAQYEFNIDWSLDAHAHELVELARASEALHTGSIGAMLEPGAHMVADALSTARESALISYDPNCRPSIVGDRSTAQGWAERFVALASVVKASDEDLTWLYPDRSLADTARAWLALGAELVVLTRGEKGPVAYTRTYPEGIEEPAYRVQVADTVGAGDSLMAALICGLLDRGIAGAKARAKVAALERGEISKLLRFSATAAGITVSRSGANPPNRNELLAVLNG